MNMIPDPSPTTNNLPIRDHEPAIVLSVDRSAGLGDQRRFLTSTARNGQITTGHLVVEDVLALRADDVDFHWNQVHGEISIRMQGGSVKRHKGGIPGLGSDTGLPLLDDVIWAAGELLQERQLRGSLRYRWTTPKARDKQVSRLRAAFGDSAAAQHYFIIASHPWRIGWNRARSWRIVEQLT